MQLSNARQISCAPFMEIGWRTDPLINQSVSQSMNRSILRVGFVVVVVCLVRCRPRTIEHRLRMNRDAVAKKAIRWLARR